MALKPVDRDVRISIHKTKTYLLVTIRFYDGLDQLLDTYVKLEMIGDRLYFKPYTEKVPDSIKLCTQGSKLQFMKNAELYKPFEGEYRTLHYDPDKDLYYVDKNEATSLSRVYGNFNCSHPNYKKHKGAVKPVVENTAVEETSTEKIPVVENLIKALFDFQVYVEGMDSAVKLLNSLNDKYK